MTEKKETEKKVIIERKTEDGKEIETYKDYSERKPKPTQSTGPRKTDQGEKE